MGSGDEGSVARRAPFYKMDQQTGANLMVSFMALGVVGKGLSVLFFIALPFIYAYNDFWSFLYAPHGLIMDCCFIVAPLIPIAIGLASEDVRTSLKTSFGMERAGKVNGEDSKPPAVSRDTMGELFGLCVASMVYWLVFMIPNIIFVNWWNTMPGTSHKFVDGSYAGVYTAENMRGGTLWFFIVIGFCAPVVFEFYLVIQALMSYFLHTSPRQMINGISSYVRAV